MLRVVFDTNVFISALLFGKTCREVMQAAIQKEIVLLSSEPIIEETVGKLRDKFQWPEPRINTFRTSVMDLAELQFPKQALSVLEDDPDNRVLECAIAGEAHLILSGDKHLRELGSYEGIPIKTPGDFIRR